MSQVLVHECVYKKLRRGDLGLELEVEAMKSLPDIKELGWVTKADGSLRYIGKEYVTSSPIKNDAHKFTKLEHLTKNIKEKGGDVLKDSHRTSFHVHRNVTSWEPHMVWNAACAYWLFEPLLVKYCGKHREGNQFCLRLKDATSLIDTCTENINQKRMMPFVEFNNADIKYSSLNLKAIPNYGSIEFRSMRGSLDPKVLDTWSTALHDMTEIAAKEFKDPAQLMDTYFGHDPIVFMGKFLPTELTKELITLGGSNSSDLITDMEPYVCEIAYATDWNRWKARVNKQWEKNKDANVNEINALRREVEAFGGVFHAEEEPPEVAELMSAWFNRADRTLRLTQRLAELMVGRYPWINRDRQHGFYTLSVRYILNRNMNAVEALVNDIDLDEGMEE